MDDVGCAGPCTGGSMSIRRGSMKLGSMTRDTFERIKLGERNVVMVAEAKSGGRER